MMKRGNLTEVYHFTYKKAYESIIKKGVIKANSESWRFYENKEMKNALEKYGANFSRLEKLLSPEQKSIVGFDSPLQKGWIKYGLMKDLLSFLNYKETKIEKPLIKKIYCFRLLVDADNLTIREHKNLSDGYVIPNFGHDITPEGEEFGDIIRNGLKVLEKLENKQLNLKIWNSFREAQKIIKNNPKELWSVFFKKIRGIKLPCTKERLKTYLVAIAGQIDYFNSIVKYKDYKGDYELPEMWYPNDYQLTPFVDGVKPVRLRSKSGKPNNIFKVLMGEKEITKNNSKKLEFSY